VAFPHCVSRGLTLRGFGESFENTAVATVLGRWSRSGGVEYRSLIGKHCRWRVKLFKGSNRLGENLLDAKRIANSWQGKISPHKVRRSPK
jgi:hypothetical protein